jgi:CRISPR-associated protein Csm1
MTISGGVALTGGKYPISRGAEHAGAAEGLAKSCREKKDAFCFLDEPLCWGDFDRASELNEILRGIVREKNKGLLDKLRCIVLVNKLLEREKQRGGWTLEQIGELLKYEKWRWQVAYSLKRYVRQGERITEDIDAIQKALLTNQIGGSPKTEKPVIRWLGLPVRWTEFLERKERD